MKEQYYEESQYQEEEYDEIDIMELFRKLLKDWKLILKWCGIAALIGLVIGFSIPKEYTVTSTLAPEITSKNGSSGLSSLAGLAGINLNSMSSTDAVSPELYPEIVSSTPFVVELFSIPVHFVYKKETFSSDLYDYVKNYTRSPWWRTVVRFPMKALSWVMNLARDNKVEPEDASPVNPYELTVEQDRILKAIRGSVSLSIDKKTSVLLLTVNAQDPKVAAKISQEVIDRLKTYVTNYRTEKARQDLEYYESLYKEAKEAYFASQQRYAGYVDRNQGVVLQRVKTEQERLQNEMNLNYQLYNTCAQQLQSAKAKVQQETPVFTVINPPQVPLERSKPSKMKILVVFVFLGAVLAAVWVLWVRDGLASLKKKDEEPEPEPEEDNPSAE